MNRDEIIRMAREAGAWSQQSKNCDVEYVMSGESLERFAALVAAAEREACAKECKFGWSSADIEQAIRARGETK